MLPLFFFFFYFFLLMLFTPFHAFSRFAAAVSRRFMPFLPPEERRRQPMPMLC